MIFHISPTPRLVGRVLVTAVALWGTATQAQAPTAAQVRSIDSVFAALDHTNSPGCALGVYRNGAIAYSRGYGMANLELGVPISSRTVFDIGSTSKQFAATAIALLEQDGKLSIDDDVRKYITELPAYQRPITIRHLLNHTSGLRDYLTLMGLHGTNFAGLTTDKDALDLIVRQRAVNFDPGSEFLYSNSGFFLLSQIVKRVSGKTLRQFADERIFRPLGMHHTHFHDDHRMLVRDRATGYSPDSSGFTTEMSLFEQTGDGAVYTTIEDLLKWDHNFFQPTVGGDALLRTLHTQGRLTSGQTIDYALGLFVDQYRGLRRVHHGGSWAGYRAELVRFPTENTSVATLCNLSSTNPTALANAVATILLKDKLGPAAAPTPRPSGVNAPDTNTMPITAAQAAEYVGTWYADEVDATYTIAASDGGITLAVANEPGIPLRASARDTFGGSGLVIRFERDRRGQPLSFSIDAGRVRGIVARRTSPVRR